MSWRLTKCDRMVVAVSILGYALLALYVHATGFNVVSSDCAMYNRWSQAWWDFSQRCPTQMPLYPIVLWVFRSLTFHLLSDGVLMQAVALLFVAGSYFYVYKILRRYLPEARAIGFVVFGLYPFVGLLCAADPRADMLAIFCLTGAAYYSLGGRWPLFALCVAAGIMTHKALWPFLVLLSVDAVWRKKCPVFWPLTALTPLLGFWAWGFSHEHDVLWLLRGNLRGEVASKSGLPIMDGLVGTFLYHRSMAKVIKACVVLGVFAVSAGLVVWNLRRFRQPDSLFNLALVFPILFLTVVLNQYEVWASVRFSQVIAIPLAAFFVANAGLRRFFERPLFFCAVALTCLLTNGLFCYYAIKVFETT